MVLAAALTLVSRFPSRYYWQTAIGVGSLVVTYAFAQGRTTNRERDLHARTILVTVSTSQNIATQPIVIILQ